MYADVFWGHIKLIVRRVCKWIVQDENVQNGVKHSHKYKGG